MVRIVCGCAGMALISHDVVSLFVPLFFGLVVPDDSSVRPEREHQTNDIGEKQHGSREPDKRPDCIEEESVGQRWALAEVASSAVGVL